MIQPDPHMSDSLFSDCLDHANGKTPHRTIDELMIDYWDEVSDAVLAFAKKYKLQPMYVIEEFCVNSDWPYDPN